VKLFGAAPSRPMAIIPRLRWYDLTAALSLHEQDPEHSADVYNGMMTWQVLCR
jgi:hypothetical protein